MAIKFIDDEPKKKTIRFLDEKEPMSFTGLIQNIKQSAQRPENIIGAVGLVSPQAGMALTAPAGLNMMKQTISTPIEKLTGIKYRTPSEIAMMATGAITGQQMPQIQQPTPEQVGTTMYEGIKKTVQDPIRSAYENPAGAALLLAPTAAKLGGKAVQTTARTAGEGLITSLIKPKQAQVKFGKNPARGVMDEGIVGLSRKNLINQVKARRNEVGQMLEDVASDPKYGNKTIDLSNATKPIDDALLTTQELPNEYAGIAARLQGLKQDILGKLGDGKITVANAIKLKRALGDVSKWRGNTVDDNVANVVKRKVYHEIDSAIDASVPELKQLNQRYSNLIGAENAATSRLQVASNANKVSIPELMIGGAAGVATQNIPQALAAMLAYRALGSTPAKTGAAQVLRGISGLGSIPAKIPSQNIFVSIGSKLAVGATMQTPKGKVRIVGKDKDGHPLIEPIQ